MTFGSVPAVPTVRHVRSGAADDIDFVIRGAEMQYVEVELDPGESAVARRRPACSAACSGPASVW
jgi:hypothetical protein